MGIGPISATQKVLEKAGLTVSDIDLFEINEAFAAQCVACQRTLGIDEDKLNVNGGGISLGHPVRRRRHGYRRAYQDGLTVILP